MKNKKKIIISSFILILMSAVVLLLFNTSQGNQASALGVLWDYKESNGEAVDVNALGCYTTYEGFAYDKTTSNFVKSGDNYITMYWYYYDLVENPNIIRAIEVPDHINGLPVTKITGEYKNSFGSFNFFNISKNTYWVGSNPPDAEGIWDTQTKVEKVILPNTLKTIGEYSFMNFKNLKEIELPSSLERIEYNAFMSSGLENIELDGLLHVGRGAFSKSKLKTAQIRNVQKLEGFGDCEELTTVTIGQGVQDIQDFGYCPNATSVHIGSDLRRLSVNAFRGMKDIYVAVDEEDVTLYNGRTGPQELGEDQQAYIHFNNHEKIDTVLPEGVKLIDVATGEEFTSKKFETGSDVTFRLEKEDGYEFDDYVVYLESFGDYYNSPKVVQKIEL